jgi:glycosyltransferase involved in cell wall biosynthesis
LKIVHVSTNDLSGGAARSAYRLHKGLLSIGNDSRMLVLEKSSSDSTVTSFNPYLPLHSRILRMLRRRYIQLSYPKTNTFSKGESYFSDDRSQYGATVIDQVSDADILNLHWIAGLLDYRDFFSTAPAGRPVVWTLHDMNPFTGGCHFDGGCGKFEKQCGACPQLASNKLDDFSRHIWTRKHRAFANVERSRLHLVTPSRWLEVEAKKSSLLSQFPSTVIPYGVDTDIFQPRDREKSRAQFRIPSNARVVLFVADWAREKRKGLDLLLSAAEGLATTADLCLVAVGRGLQEELLPKQSRVIEYISDDVSMSHLYSAADLFVIPSLQDNFPNTMLEAISCGTPVVGFNVGGLPDLVREGQTGRLVVPGDVSGLRQAILDLLSLPNLLATLGAECRQVATSEFSLTIQANRYAALYAQILEDRGAPPPR